MNETRRKEYFSKYARTGEATIIRGGEYKYPQMKSDSFYMDVESDFGAYGGGTLWAYVWEPVDMQPEPVVSKQSRYITVFGGDATDFRKLHGEAVVMLGKSKENMQQFNLEEAFGVYVEENMLYAISIKRIDNPKLPLLFSELIVGANAPAEENPKTDESEGYGKYIKSGEELNTNYPDKENLMTVLTTTHHMFGGKELVRRTWMPIIKPHTMAKNSHTHTFSEYLVFMGSDPENISDLGGVVEFTIGENENELETFRIDKATQFHLAKGVWHSPLVFKEVKNPNMPVILCEVSYATALEQDKELDNSIEENDWRIVD